MQQLFQSVREAATATVWSRGVELARRGAVSEQSRSPEEVVARVEHGAYLVPPTVCLSLAHEDWDCSCESGEDPCEHVAASVIALRQAAREGVALAATESAAHVGYRFTRRGRQLALARCIASGGTEKPLLSSVRAVASGRVSGPRLLPSEADLELDEELRVRSEDVLPAGVLQRLLPRLSECSDVTLDGEPVQVSREPLLPIAMVQAQGEGFVVQVRRDRGVQEQFTNGVARVSGVLRPIGDPHLTQRERGDWLPGRYYGPNEVHDLVSRVLPDLERRIPVRRDARLPSASRAPARLRIEVERSGARLRVRPDIVYGDPPIAKLEHEQLVLLGSTLPVRDERAERRLAADLRRQLGLMVGVSVELAATDAIALRSALEGMESAVVGSAHREFFEADALTPRLNLDPGQFSAHFDVEGAADGKGRRADGEQVLRAWQRGESLVPLLGGGFAPLPEDWLERHGSTLADLLAARRDSGELPPAALPDLGRLCESLGAPPPPSLARLQERLERADSSEPPELPDDLEAVLRPYQSEGIHWLATLRESGLGALLADDMGLGKTLQALCAVRGRTLVVCPTSVLHGWRTQIERFRPALRTCTYHGPRRELDSEADVTLTSYALLRLDSDVLGTVPWESVVLDEAQSIKNPDSQVARAAFALRAEFRATLTGTPVENRLDELWSQMHFLNPGLLGRREDFAERYARPVAAGDAEAAQRLRQRIRPFVLRRLKRDVAPDLPPRTDEILHCELSESERAAYDAVRAATHREIVERLSSGGNVIEALEALLRLRQAACHPGLLPGQSAPSSSKLEVLVESLSEAVAEGHKALVFSQWTQLLDLVEARLEPEAIPYLRLDGSTRDRAAVIDGFQDPDGPPLLLISLRAGGTGLDLTSADHVFLLDPWWNPAVEEQAADRAHRIGQERPVFVYRLVARETVEERILELQQRKRALADAALGEGSTAGGLTREDLLALLE